MVADRRILNGLADPRTGIGVIFIHSGTVRKYEIKNLRVAPLAGKSGGEEWKSIELVFTPGGSFVNDILIFEPIGSVDLHSVVGNCRLWRRSSHKMDSHK